MKYCMLLDREGLRESFEHGCTAMIDEEDRPWVAFLDKLRAVCGEATTAVERALHEHVFDPRSAELYGRYAEAYWKSFEILLKRHMHNFATF